MKILLTGMAGFVGYHTAQYLRNDFDIIGIDNINDYYSTDLKYGRLHHLGFKDIKDSEINISKNGQLSFYKMDLNDSRINNLFEEHKFDFVIHLAAQTGVRYSLENPEAYTKSNVDGFLKILEACKKNPVKHLIYASSSSVYGFNQKVPYSESDNVDQPVSVYAATKRTNELMAHTYSYLYKIPVTGLRFFTVYGPWGRPDMAYYSFTEKIVRGDSIDIYNHGKMMRDFTYIDDIVESIKRLITIPPKKNRDSSQTSKSESLSRICNIGNNNPIELLEFVEIMEKVIGKKANKHFKDMKPGDVQRTWADIGLLNMITGFSPATPFKEGFLSFYKWYCNYNKL